MIIIRGKWRRRGFGIIGCSLIACCYYNFVLLPTPEEMQARTEIRLDQISAFAQMQDTPLADALDTLSKTSGVKISADWERLKEIDVEPTTPITLRLKNVKMSKLLHTVLAEASNEPTDITRMTRDDGTIIVTTTKALSQYAVERRFDARGLYIPLISFETRSSEETNAFDQARSEQLAILITETVDSDSWICNGGSVGKIRFENGWGIVWQTPENQRAVIRLLEQVNETRGCASPVLASRLMERQ